MKFSPRFMTSGIMLIAAGMTALPALAQERSANNASDIQASWTALHTLAASAQAKSDVIDARLQNIVRCGMKAMSYAPGAGADSDNCIENAKVTSQSQSIDAINQQITDMDTKIATLNAGLSSMSAKLTTFDTNVVSMNSSVTSLNNTATDLRAKSADAAAKITTLSSQFVTINSQLTSLQALYDSQNSQITDAYAKIQSLNARIKSANDLITTLNATVSYVNGLVAPLNANMANVLYCGSYNYVFNRNVGCVAPTVSGSCSMVPAGSGIAVVTGSTYSCHREGGPDTNTICTSTPTYTTYNISCS